jgi:hypothetical protein
MTAAVRPMAVMNALRRVINLRAGRGAALRGVSLGVSLRLSSGIEAETALARQKILLQILPGEFERSVT